MFQQPYIRLWKCVFQSNWTSLACMKNQDLKPCSTLTYYSVWDTNGVTWRVSIVHQTVKQIIFKKVAGYSSAIFNLTPAQISGAFRAPIASMLGFFVKLVSGWKLLASITKSSILAVDGPGYISVFYQKTSQCNLNSCHWFRSMKKEYGNFPFSPDIILK